MIVPTAKYTWKNGNKVYHVDFRLLQGQKVVPGLILILLVCASKCTQKSATCWLRV